MNLLPDPEGQNDARAGWAHQAIQTFEIATSCDRCDTLGDLLANLMHWCDRNEQDFETELERARGHYEAETGGEE